MRQEHRPGEKLFVDWAGDKIPLHDREKGTVHEASLFVAVLGASNYTYAEACWSEQLEAWIGAHIRAFEFFQALPELIIPDNLKAGVSRACRYEPDLNRTYQEMAQPYGLGVLPARRRKPKDKDHASYCTSLDILDNFGCKLRVTSPISESLAGLSLRHGTNDWLEKYESTIIRTHSFQNTFCGEASGGSEVHALLCRDFGRGEPALAAKMFEVRRDAISVANVANDEARENVLSATAEVTRVERACNLPIRLLEGPGAHEFDDL
jgi:Integrase core domain